MSWLVAAAVGYGAYKLGKGKGEDESGEGAFETQGVVDPLKKAVATPLSEFLAKQVGTGLPEYTGPEAAPFSADADARISEFLKLNPEQFFQEKIVSPVMSEFRKEGVPLLEEGYAGALRGSGRFGGVEEGFADVSKELTEFGAQFVPGIYKSQADVATQRKILGEAEEETNYNRWVQTLPQYNPAMGQAIAFLNQSTSSGTDVLAATKAPKENWVGQLLGTVIGAGATLGAAKIMVACFDANTYVVAEQGLTKISEVRQGDKVMGMSGLVEVIAVYSEQSKPTLEINEIKTTEEHPFVGIHGQLVQAKDLAIGDILYGDVMIETIKPCESGSDKRYNLEVLNHYYTLNGGVLVHDGREVG